MLLLLPVFACCFLAGSRITELYQQQRSFMMNLGKFSSSRWLPFDCLSPCVCFSTQTVERALVFSSSETIFRRPSLSSCSSSHEPLSLPAAAAAAAQVLMLINLLPSSSGSH